MVGGGGVSGRGAAHHVRADAARLAGQLVFSYHGDIWIANANGANPLRLTANLARNTFPRLSPDGKSVAFTSNRMGNDDVWVMPATGGEPRQLTFFSGSDAVLGWTPDGQRVLFSTSRGPGAWGSPLYTVSRDGGLPEPLPMDRAGDGMIRQDGAAVAFNRGAFRFTRKGYRGNSSEDVWVQDLKTKAFTRLTDTDRKAVKTHVQDVNPMWGADGQVYFVSERDGFFNVWKVAPAGGAPAQVTSFKKDGVQFASMSPDGKTIAFENEFEMWTLDVPGGTPRKVVVDIEADSKENLVEMLPSKNKADGFDPTPDGDGVAIEFHGEIFVVPTDPEIGEKRQVTSSPRRDQRPVVSPDGRYVAYISDESKEQEFWLFDRQGGSRRKLTTHASFKDAAVWAPDSKRLAVTAANRLFTHRPRHECRDGGGLQPGRRLPGEPVLARRQVADLRAQRRPAEPRHLRVRDRGEARAQPHRQPVHRDARRAHAGWPETRVRCPIAPTASPTCSSRPSRSSPKTRTTRSSRSA